MLNQQELLDKVKIYNNYIDESVVKKAYNFAFNVHRNQKRLSGDPYITHPIAVAAILCDLKVDTATITTALLHDTIEDTVLTKEMIDCIFGSVIAEQVEALTRIKINEKISAGELVDLLFKQEREDLLLIKYFDRLHNMQTISAKSYEKISKTVEETFKKFISLSIYLEASLPKLLKTNEDLLNLCCQQLLIKQPYLSPYCVMKISEDTFQLPFLTVQNEKFQN